jgi:hypothetical protein
MERHGSLNHIFRLVWSQVLGCWVAVAENTCAGGKSASRKLVAATLLLAGATALAAPLSGQMTGSSQFIADAQVSAGGLVASMLDLNLGASNGKLRSFGGNGNGTGSLSVANQDNIDAASGGYVAYISNRSSNRSSNYVSNPVAITAPLGSVMPRTGNAATLTFSANQLVSFEVKQSMLESLANNGGMIQADGGRVILSAGAKAELRASVVNNTGVIRARTVENLPGNITVLGGAVSGNASDISNRYTKSNVGSTAQSGRISNDMLARNQSVTAGITAKALTQGAVANTYDGNTVAAQNVAKITDLGDGEALSLSGLFSDNNVGNGKAMTMSAVASAGDTRLVSNDMVANPDSLTAAITQQALTIDVTVNNKTYDGNAVAALSVAKITDLLDDETPVLGNEFNAQNAGSGKVVIGAGVDTATAVASNYIFFNPDSLTAAITQKTLTRSEAVSNPGNPSNKISDGNTVAALNVTKNSRPVDDQTLGLSSRFSDASTGLGKLVTIADVSTTTGLADNFNLIQPARLSAHNTASAPLIATRASSVSSSVSGISVAEVAGKGNAAERALTGFGSADKISSSTLFGLSASLKVVDGGAMLH